MALTFLWLLLSTGQPSLADRACAPAGKVPLPESSSCKAGRRHGGPERVCKCLFWDFSGTRDRIISKQEKLTLVNTEIFYLLSPRYLNLEHHVSEVQNSGNDSS